MTTDTGLEPTYVDADTGIPIYATVELPDGTTMALPLMAVADIVEHPRNPNQGDVGAIIESIRENGVFDVVKIQRSTGYAIAGNHTTKAARELGMAGLPYVHVDVDDETALRMLLTHNRTRDRATYDERALADLLVDVQRDTDRGLAGTGWDDDDLDRILADLGRQVEFTAHDHPHDDDVIPPPPVPVTQPGDVWELGPHRLLCGDATDPTAYDRLLAGERASLVWTDPPYGVSYVGKTSDALTIDNDAPADDEALYVMLDDAFAHTLEHCNPGAPWYVTAPPGPTFAVFTQVLKERGVWHQTLVWIKDVFVLGHSDYHYRHEPIIYGWKPGAAHYTSGDRTLDSVWEIPRPKASLEHPTMKPVELVARAIRTSTNPSAIVLDPFAGSGTTLLAADRLGRRAALLEIDPVYCDVVAHRAEQALGLVPQRNGAAHSFL